jgi:hypothetical protein
VDLYVHSPIRLHGLIWTTLPYLNTVFTSDSLKNPFLFVALLLSRPTLMLFRYYSFVFIHVLGALAIREAPIKFCSPFTHLFVRAQQFGS